VSGLAEEASELRLTTLVTGTTMQLQQLFSEMIEKEASDLHLKAGRPPLMRIHGELLPTSHPEMSADEVRALVYTILTGPQIQAFEKDLELDTAYTFEERARFRVNVFVQRQTCGAVMRLIPLRVPTVDELRLPSVLKDLALREQGLILFTGPTGSGKSTSMAAMINHVNDNQHRHVMTIEDPIEFVHRDKLATINQRELGSDTRSLEEALRHVLRQDPDVILIGEMRDPETMETAMRAAETGHLVFSTLHTNDAKQTMDRILDSFEGNRQRQTRTLLSLVLLAVLAQRLVMRADGKGRVAALEIMVNSPNIAQLLAKGKTHELEAAIAKGHTYWRMQTFNQSLCSLAKDGTVTPETALENSSSPGDLRLMLRGVGLGSAAIDSLAEKLEKEGLGVVEAEEADESGNAASKKTKMDDGFSF
jgi:twitching motility protein PilT